MYRSNPIRFISEVLLATLVAGGAAVALAQNSPDGGALQQADGPGRGVARLSLLNGDVSVRRGDSGELIAGALNVPLMVGDSVLTGNQSRAEMQFDHANMLRLGAMAEVRISELEFRRYMLQLSGGTVTFRVLRNSEAQVELGTPSVAIRPVHKGIYRVTVRPDFTSEITVRQGTLEVYTPRGSEQLHQGQTMVARGQTDPEFQVYTAPYEDEWDRWNQSRDQQLEHSNAYQYVSPDVYGAEDLDGQGQWVNNAAYGEVWTPAVTSADWAPYRNGRWVWEDYYGWTWVSYDPWGWAPYHYGRWFWDTNYGWCWWPGARGARNSYWRPALVGFFGFGSGFGSIGWVPLAPYEPFHPWWGHGIYDGYRTGGFLGAGYAPGVNLTLVYRNARFEHGVTGIAASQFGRSAVTAQTMTRVTRGDLMNTGMVHGALPVSPDRTSLHVVDRTPRAGFGQTANGAGRFYSTRQASPVNRVPFEQQRQVISSGGVGGWRPAAGSPVQAGGGWRPAPGYQPYPQQQAPATRSPQPMRMSPSIVQPRPNPSYQPASSTQPQYRQAPPPRSQAPPPAAAPSGSRGGGGGSHSNGGGGGGRPSGHSR